MLTNKQTVDILLDCSNDAYQVMEYKPTPPFDLHDLIQETGIPAAIKRDEGIYYWYPDGEVRVEMENGTIKTFYPKPTLADAVLYEGKSAFFEFHTDGSVSALAWNGHYKWSADELGFPYIVDYFDRSQIRLPRWCKTHDIYLFEHEWDMYHPNGCCNLKGNGC